MKVAEQLGIPTTYKRNVCLDVLNYNSDVDSLSGHSLVGWQRFNYKAINANGLIQSRA